MAKENLDAFTDADASGAISLPQAQRPAVKSAV